MAQFRLKSFTGRTSALRLPGPVYWLLLLLLTTTLMMITTFAVDTQFPVFTTTPINTTVNVTEPLTVACRAELSTGESTKSSPVSMPIIRWFRALRTNQADILIASFGHIRDVSKDEDKDEEEEDIRVGVTLEGDLVFKKVLSEDDGWYYCTAGSRDAVIVYSDPVYFNVQVPPVVTYISKPPETPYQGQVNLSCSATADPVAEITWRSPRGREVNVSEAGYGLADGLLTISSTTNEKDGGLWTCVACNMLGCGEATTLLRAHGVPIIQDAQASQESTTVRIACQALGLPAPVFTYFTEGNTVGDMEGHAAVEGQLYVGKGWLKETYTCTATNQYGQDSLTIYRPLAPELLTATASVRSVTVVLTTANKLGRLPLVGVSVEFRTPNQVNWTAKYVPATSTDPSDPGAESSSLTGPGDYIMAIGSTGSDPVEDAEDEATGGDLQVTATGLDPYTVYSVQVKLVNVLGEGPPSSDSLGIFTLADVPPPPEEVNVTSGNNGLTITWKVPQHLNGDKADVYFKVIVANSSGSIVSQSLLPATHTPKVITPDLDLGNHSVSIATVNVELQRSSDNVTLLVVVTQTVPEFVPSILSSVALNDHTVSVTWEIPDDLTSLKHPVEGYVIRVVSASFSQTKFFHVNGSMISAYNVTGLEERASYTCSVAAFNIGGRGTFSPSSAVTTHYTLFSRSAYSPEVNLDMSGKWIAVLAGCLSSVVLVFLVGFLIRHWHSYNHTNTLDLMEVTHGLDPSYLENPKGLYQTTHWNTVSWLRSFGAGQIFGTSSNSINITTSTINTTTNNNNTTVINHYSSNRQRADEGVPGTRGVAVVAMETTSGGQQTLGNEGDQRRDKTPPWWRRLRLFPSTWTTPHFISVLSSKRLGRNRKSTRPTISHPHFSGRGATVTMTSSSATSPPPVWTTYDHQRPLTLIPRYLSLDGDHPGGDDFPEGISLSSSSGDSLTSVSSEANDLQVHCSPLTHRTPQLDAPSGEIRTEAAAVCPMEERAEASNAGPCREIQGMGQNGSHSKPAADSRSVGSCPKDNVGEHLRRTYNKKETHQPDEDEDIYQYNKDDTYYGDMQKTHQCDHKHAHEPDKQHVGDKKFIKDPEPSLYKEHADSESNTECKLRQFNQEQLSNRPRVNAGNLTDREANDQDTQVLGSNSLNDPKNNDSAFCEGYDRKKSKDDTEIHVLELSHKEICDMTPSDQIVTVPKKLLTLKRLNAENTDHVGAVTMDGQCAERGPQANGNNARTFNHQDSHDEPAGHEDTAIVSNPDHFGDGMSLQQLSPEHTDRISMKTAGENLSVGEPSLAVCSGGCVSIDTVRECTPLRGPADERGDDVMHEADQAVTVTDGESVYHILQRLDQELDAHELSDTLDTDTEDEDSLGGSWTPPSTGGEDPLNPAFAPLSLHGYGFSGRKVHCELSQRGSSHEDNRPADTCRLRENEFLNKNRHGELCERGVTPASPHGYSSPTHEHLSHSIHHLNIHSHSQPNQNQQQTSGKKSLTTGAELSPNIKHFPSWKKPSLFRSQQHWVGLKDSAQPAALDEGTDTGQHSSTDTDHSFTSIGKSSPTLNKAFNAESDSYDVNPLQSPSSWGPASANLYCQDRPSTFSKAHQHPANFRQLFPAHTVTEKSVARRHPVNLDQLFPPEKNTSGKPFFQKLSGSRAADASGRKVLEELVSALDSLEPSSYPDTGRRPGPQTFYTLQRKPTPVGTLWQHGLGTNAAGNPRTKFYTLRQESSSSLDRNKVYGAVQSLDSPGSAGRRRSELSDRDADLFTRLAHVSQPETGWPIHSVSAGTSLDTPRREKRSKRNMLTMPRLGFMDQFRRHSSSLSPSLGSSSDGHHKRGELSEVGVNPASRGCAAVKEDAVFGKNNVGFETANLY